MANGSKIEKRDESVGAWAVAPLQPWMEAWLGMWSSDASASSGWPFNNWPLAPTGGEKAAAEEAAPAPFGAELWPIGFWSLASGRAPQNPIETWLSYTPAAPFFGLRWAFADMETPFTRMAADEAGGESALALSSQAQRERAALNRRVVGRRIETAPAATGEITATAPASEKRKPRLRVVDGGAEDGKADPAPQPSAEKPVEAAPAPRKPEPTKAAAEAAKLARAAKPPRRAAPTPPAEKAGPPDDLTAIKGVGEKLAALLGELGVRRFDELAAMKPADFEKLDEKLGTFRGRWKRDDWAGQAAALAKAKK